MIESAALVPEVPIGRPAALAEQFRTDHHVHAAVDNPVVLLADDEALDGRVADNRNQKSALAPGLVHRMTEVGQVEDRHAKQLEEGV